MSCGLSLLGLENDFLEVGLQLLDIFRLISNLALESCLESLLHGNFLVKECNTLRHLVFDIKQALLHEDGSDHLVNDSILAEEVELSHDHLVLALLLRQLPLVKQDLSELWARDMMLG